MPKTTPKTEVPATTAWDGKAAPKYVRLDLSTEQKKLLATWAAELENIDLLTWMENQVSRGHVLSVRSNEVGYQCSLTGTREASGHMGMCLVGRASTAIRAVEAVMYRDEMVLQGVWPVSSLTSDLDF